MSRSPTHGESGRKTPEYTAWSNMLDRCFNEKHPWFHRYGGRGITVCPEWLGPTGYVCFLTHVGRRPGPGFSLDRADNDRGYEPGNVRWATKREQTANSHRANQWTANGRHTYTGELFAFIAEHPGLTSREMRERGLRREAINLLGHLTKTGQIQKTGSGRSHRYYMNVSIINADPSTDLVQLCDRILP